MEAYDLAEAAKRIGLNVDELSRLVELGSSRRTARTGSRRVICAAQGS